MRTPAQIAEYVYPGNGPIAREKRDSLIRQINEFTEFKIKEHLSRAAENARTRTNDESTSIIVDRDSITNISIELP